MLSQSSTVTHISPFVLKTKCRDSLARKQFCCIMHTFIITLETVSVQNGKKPVKLKNLVGNEMKEGDDRNNPKKRGEFSFLLKKNSGDRFGVPTSYRPWG